MTSKFELIPLKGADLISYGQARARDIAFDAVRRLWERRKKEGMKQKDLADILGIDESRISHAMKGPGNWTFKTFGSLIAAMDGDFEIEVYANSDAPTHQLNYSAYDDVPQSETSSRRTKLLEGGELAESKHETKRISVHMVAA